MKSTTILMAGAALVLLACSPSGFNTPTLLNKVRILAMQADPAQPALGASTTLRALVYQPPLSADAGATVTGYSWSWCPLPMSPTNISQCPIAPTDQSAADQLFASVGITGAPPLDLGAGETATFTNPFPAALLANLCMNGLGAGLAGSDAGTGASKGTGGASFDCTIAGFPITVVLVVHTSAGADAGDSPLPAVFTVYLPINDAIAPNLNPVVGGISVTVNKIDRPLDQAGTQEVPRNSSVPVSIDVPASSSEVQPDPKDVVSDPTKLTNLPVVGTTEELDMSWYAECGDFGANGLGGRRTGYLGDPTNANSTFENAKQNTWNIPKFEGCAVDTARMIVVVRDNRGGVAWTSGVAHVVDSLSDAGAPDSPQIDSGEPDAEALDSEEADSADAEQESAL
jgi:hypothetical protein